ncbi:MAG TPA: TonB-dependent receptor [Rhodopila sp.]|nr:TonB-dependent receptor [Rhodopila sp.]
MAGLVVFGSIPAIAADTTAPVINLGPIEVNAAPYRPLDDAPQGVLTPAPGQTVTTLDRSRFDAQPSSNIGEVLQQVPGVSYITGNGPRDISISIRGSNERQTYAVRNIQMFEDGFPVTQPDGTGRTDLTDPHAYSQIDVIRGPSSAVYGNYATGGAINFITRHGGDIHGVEFGTDAGSFGYLNNYATAGWSGKGFEASIFASNVRGDGFISNSRYDTATVNALASIDVTENDRVTLKIIQNSLDAFLPIRLSLNQYNQNPFQKNCSNPSVPGCATVTLFNNGRNGPTTRLTASQAGLGRFDNRSILGLRWEHTFDGDTVWRTQLVLDDRNIKQPTNSTSSVGPFTSINVMSDLTRRGTLLGLESTSSIGVNFNEERMESYTYNLLPVGNHTQGSLTQTVFGNVTNAGGRAREEIALTPKVSAVFALGGEYTEIKATQQAFGYPLAGGTTVSTIPVLRTFGNVAPEAALLYRPTKEWMLHTRVATGYGTPQPTNLFTTPSGLPGNNTNLQTQSNVGIDLGMNYDIADRLAVELTGFYEFFHNEIVTQSAGANLPSFSFNVPHSEHRGIEFGISAHPLPVQLPGLYVLASYLFDDQIYTQYVERLSNAATTQLFNRAGNKIPGVTPNFLFARVGYEHSEGKFKGLGGFVEVDYRDAFYVDNGNQLKAPGFAIVNLQAHWDPGIKLGAVSKIRAFFEIQNVFDTTYIASANNLADTLGANGQQNSAAVLANTGGAIYAGSPRAFIAGVRIAL